MELSLSKGDRTKRYTDIFIVLFIFAALFRFAVGIGFYNPQDTLWYKEWALSLNNGLFDIYTRADEVALDYPPIYLFFLRITGTFYNSFGSEVNGYTDMLIMKFWPMVGDLLCGAAVYFVFKKINIKVGLAASLLWLFNPSAILNSSLWGQTDSIMCLLLLLSFVLLERRPVLASVMFAVAGMTKFQCLYFTPLFLTELFLKHRLKQLFYGIASAAATVAAVFLPFMLASGNPMLFFDVYLKGQGLYPYCTLSAYNIYGLLGLNWVEDNLGIFSLYTFSLAIIVILVALLIAALVVARRPSVWVVGFLFMNTLFMFTTRMHERYQFVVLIFLLAAAVYHRHRGFFYCFAAMSAMTLINQLIPLFAWRDSGSFFSLYYGDLMTFFSAVNLVLWVVSAYVSVKFLFTPADGSDGQTQNSIFKEEAAE